MGHFRSNLRDLEFNLFEVFRVQDQLDTAPFDPKVEEYQIIAPIAGG